MRGIFTTDVSENNRGFNIGRADKGGADGLHTNSFGRTSATPLAAGVAALVLSINPNLTRTDLRDVLASTADKIGSGYDSRGHSNEFGFGRIDAGAAVQAAQAMLKTAKTAGKQGGTKKAGKAKNAGKAKKRRVLIRQLKKPLRSVNSFV